MKESIKLYNISSCNEMFNLLESENHLQGYIFRGQQRSDWLLKPSFFRNEDIDDYNSFILLKRHLEKFKIFTRGRITNLRTMSEDEIWSIGQHYGLLTPLLDWTASPYIALFFASKILNADKSDHCLYGLNTKMINKQIYYSISNTIDSDKELMAQFENRYGLQGYSEKEKMILIGKLTSQSILDGENIPADGKKLINNIILENISIVNPKIDNNPRLLSQRGIFTKTNINKTIEEIVESTKYVENNTVLIKIIIPDKIAYEIKEHLNNMNINDLSLFPDLEGTANYCNYKLSKEASLSFDDIDRLNIENIWI